MDRARLLIADLERIPDVVRAHAAAGVPDLGAQAPRRIVLTGLGSSRFAALALASTLREAGLEVVVEHASTSRPVPVAAGTRYDAELFGTIQGRGGHIVAIGPTVGSAAAAAAVAAPNLAIPLPLPALRDPLVRAIAEPLVTSSLAAELWRRTRTSDG